MDSGKPLVKVGGGYLSIEQFLSYVLEKIKKTSLKSPKNSNNSEPVDPELIQKLSNYLSEMKNLDIQQKEDKKRTSFQGKKTFSNDSPTNLSRGSSFMKAVVGKDVGSPTNSASPKNQRKSVQLLDDFSINIIKGT